MMMVWDDKVVKRELRDQRGQKIKSWMVVEEEEGMVSLLSLEPSRECRLLLV